MGNHCVSTIEYLVKGALLCYTVSCVPRARGVMVALLPLTRSGAGSIPVGSTPKAPLQRGLWLMSFDCYCFS